VATLLPRETLNLEPLTQHLMLPDPWQHRAVTHLRDGSDVIVSAPTGAGKTLVFELFVKSARLRAQAVYTVPTRALANDKYAEWKGAGWQVGLATGDISENVRAPVLVATLETQLERLLTGEGPSILVLDEFQMISDAARGPHYEGAIVLAPAATQLLLLSGSVENPQEIAEWMRRIGRKVEVIATRERPVPLDEMPVETLPLRHRNIEGGWPRLATAVLLADLAPLLIFAPRRRDAENIANKLGTHLPPGEPLSLTPAQRALAGREFAALLEKRVAYHHSGLGYALRAGLVEPLAKAGQLRVIVSTMGLAAGINFSVRSVHVSSTTFHDGTAEQSLTPDELLQMFGRAGRRGLDERGYVITSRDSPTLSDARAARLRRASRLSWPLFLRIMRRASLDARPPFDAAREFAQKLFAKTAPELGLEATGGFEMGGAAVSALFGLKATRRDLFNSNGAWEEHPSRDTTMVPLSETWLAREDHLGPALAHPKFVHSLTPGLGRLFKLPPRGGAPCYGKEIALGARSDEGDAIVPTQSLRRLLRIPKKIPSLSPEKVEKVALPKLTKIFQGGALHGFADKEGLRWAQFDYSAMPVQAVRDSLGRWLVEARIRTVELSAETEIQDNIASPAHTVRPGTPVHAWRALGLIEADGAPTRRGIIFSFFQHGEGLAIAAALEDESYPTEDLILHLANLRSDCRVDLPEPGASERLAATCRATYGFVNHHGYLEAGLPVGYGEGTAELLGLIPASEKEKPAPAVFQTRSRHEVSEGDLSRAQIEWLSLLRHVAHAPAYDWPRWTALRHTAGRRLADHVASVGPALPSSFPPLTAKQKHERPKHWIR
jgi:superfamily II DNA/RNA helicase